ncbi:hypothetical protein [Butyrivibrio sp. MC2013]|uniref:hypothetical protein n=1 Tax=Butyrivibrio sp. MC2013 TaxID=1280686 RepID=UPI00040AD8E4|nr:hypothetical protein [Butyrivibrio sp. MC2013]
MPHKPLQTYDRKMKRFVTASESKAVTADGISNRNTLDTYHARINRLFENGKVDANKSLALFIHENIEYSADNRDCWYYLEAKMKPMMMKAYEKIGTGDVYILTGEEQYGE